MLKVTVVLITTLKGIGGEYWEFLFVGLELALLNV